MSSCGNSGRRRYSGGRMRSNGGFGLTPLLLVAVIALVAWHLHGGHLPSVAHLQSMLGR